MEKQPVFVGIVKDEKQWKTINDKRWYHLPVSVNSAPEKPELIKYVAFYFPKSFDSTRRCKIIYYADVLKLEIKKRIELFPDEPENNNAEKDYFQFYLGEIKELPKTIVSKTERSDIVHIPTNTEKLFSAREINDLWWENSPLEDIMHSEFRRRGIDAERQWHVFTGGQHYFLDFALFPGGQKIDIECDGGQHFATQEAITADKKRDALLKADGWKVLRFTWDEIHQDLKGCLQAIETI